ncbi:short-chain dehydrogenase [Pholiota conissans]|uniref:Short-chain dehydrogenase n=1 Tax=Pholiota conissans TaxID=109636 RepID=A0A9P5ZD59_9AGAR|nr:short-chain dehydrogenase [Pholiota conissans]
MKFTITRFISEQWNPVPEVVQTSLEGKTVIVTGANNGIGFEAAKHFARMNPGRLIMACRSQQRGEEAVSNLKRETGYSNVELWMLDLASFASVQTFSERFNKEGGRLDILVENAGILPEKTFKLTDDGWEPVFQVNNLSTSLLALLLLPRLVETAQKYQTTPRLVIVSSEMHFVTTIDEAVLENDNPLAMFGSSEQYIQGALKTRYEDSKLLNVFFARALNEKIRHQALIINSVTPGYCYSSLRKNFSGLRAWVDWLMEKALARTAEEGSRQLIWAAVGGADDEEALRGAYISLAQIREPSDYVVERKDVQDKLWENLLDELIKIDASIQDIREEHFKQSAEA